MSVTAEPRNELKIFAACKVNWFEINMGIQAGKWLAGDSTHPGNLSLFHTISILS